MEITEKMLLLGRINATIVDPGNYKRLEKIIEQTSRGVVLISENSMIDLDRISSAGKIGEEAYGNRKVFHQANHYLESMKRKKEAIFFPGTYLKNYGGFYLPVMPVVMGGEIIERIKFTSEEKVDSYEDLARQLLGQKYAKKIAMANGGFLMDEPYRTLINEMKKRSQKLKAQKNLSYNYRGLNLAPIICNEIDIFCELYTGKPIDVILHSADNLNFTDEERLDKYQKFMEKLALQKKLSSDSILAVAENGKNPFTGIFSFSTKGKLKKIN